MQNYSLEKPLTLFDLVAACFRYKWRFAFVTLLTMLAAGAVIFLFPRSYESEAKLLIKVGRSTAGLDPTAVGPTIAIQETRDTEINSMVDLLTSRGLFERVVDEIGVDRLLEKHSWIGRKMEEAQKHVVKLLEEQGVRLSIDSEQPPEAEPLASDDIQALKKREEAIEEISQHLRVGATKKSNTIGLSYRGGTPTLARDVVSTIIRCYKQLHIEAYGSDSALDFFSKRFSEQEQLLSAHENTLREAKNENAIVTMRGKQEQLQDEISNVKQMQLTTGADLDAARARVGNLEKSLNELPEEIVSEKSLGNPAHATDLMRDRLFELEIEEKSLAEKYVASHPELKRVREQLEQAKKVVNEQPDEREQSRIAVNPVRMGIQNELLLAQSTVQSLSARMKTLAAQERQLGDQLSEVNRLELVSEDLQRQVDVGRENYNIYARKLEESKLNSALDQDSMSNVSIVNPPSLNYKAVSPNRKLLAALAGLFALFSGFATAMLGEFRSRSRDMDEIRELERQRYLEEMRFYRAEAAARNIGSTLANDSHAPTTKHIGSGPAHRSNLDAPDPKVKVPAIGVEPSAEAGESDEKRSNQRAK